MESERWKTIDSKLSPGIVIYDKLLDKVSIEIATGNKQMNEYIAKAAYLCIHDPEFLDHVISYDEGDL